MTDPHPLPSKEEAEDALADIGEYLDGCPPTRFLDNFRVRSDQFLTLLTLARIGFKAVYQEEETVEKVKLAVVEYFRDGPGTWFYDEQFAKDGTIGVEIDQLDVGALARAALDAMR